MGGDYFPSAPVEGALRAQARLGDEVRLVLIGDQQVIEAEIVKQGGNPAHFVIVHTDEYIEMSESPTKALGRKPRSSITLGVGMMKQGQLDGFVSAGNTGAMLVASALGLGNIEGVSRPTIGVMFPTETDKQALLCDVGANIECKPIMLKQFGILASVYLRTVVGIENPEVALLNVGEEEGKGPEDVKEAYKLMAEEPRINFVGNLEGRDLWAGKADIYVCDGYTGNIVLKFGESLYDTLKARNPGDEFMERFNFENYGGVPVLGINGISIIGHGISTGRAIENMVYQAVTAVKNDLVGKIKTAFQSNQEETPNPSA